MAGDNSKLIGELRVGTSKIPEDVKNINKELDKVVKKFEQIEGEEKKLIQETKIMTNEYGMQTKIVDKLNKETQKLERTIEDLTMDYKKLGTEMGKAREQNTVKLHTEALQINKQIDTEIIKRKLSLVKKEQLELRTQQNIIADRKRLEESYEQWWLKNLKEQEIKAEQSARRIAQQQTLRTQQISGSQFQNALTARQGMNIFGGTSTMGSGDARASVIGKVLNSAIYTASYVALSTLTNTVSQAIETNKQYELGLVDLSRTLNNVTNTDLKAYGKQAIQFAKDFAAPLQEVQNAMTELARAGVDNKADLEAMTKAVLTGLNTTEIKDATTMTGYLVSAVKQLDMEFSDSMKIIDGWNKMAD